MEMAFAVGRLEKGKFLCKTIQADLLKIEASGQPYAAKSLAFFSIVSVALPSFSSRAAALSVASRNALRHSSGEQAWSLRPRLPISLPEVTPAENISTISGSATTHA
jgi:hypothetical protein